MTDYNQLFALFPSVKVAVIGDVMLDNYMWGTVERISPEAPVPVVTLNRKEYRIGGAGNVALNAVALGARVAILSVTGKDAEAEQLQLLLKENNINTTCLLQTDSRSTTTKTRIISRNQQMLRIDAEITTDLNAVDENNFLAAIAAYLDNDKPDVLIFEDYNKGVLTPGIISQVITWCREKGIITAVDPKRKNFFAYRNADIFKPNLKEVKEALNWLSDDVSLQSLHNIHTQLHQPLQHRISFITLSEKGVFFQEDEAGTIIPAHLRKIADVSGAGDTVIAVASLVYAATKNFNLAASVANIAGGLVCEQVGTAAINKDALLKECRQLLA